MPGSVTISCSKSGWLLWKSRRMPVRAPPQVAPPAPEPVPLPDPVAEDASSLLLCVLVDAEPLAESAEPVVVPLHPSPKAARRASFADGRRIGDGSQQASY